MGAALAWAGRADEASATLAIALVRTKDERRVTAHAMALVAAALAEYHSGTDTTASATQRALDFATTSGLGEYHGCSAPTIAIAAVTARSGEPATDEVLRAVALARRASTDSASPSSSPSPATCCWTPVTRWRRAAARGPPRDRPVLRPRHHAATVRTGGRSTPPRDRRPTSTTDLVEPLSDRELVVLRFLPSTLSLPEIARELYVSPNTVKTQCAAIYRKLGVNEPRRRRPSGARASS